MKFKILLKRGGNRYLLPDEKCAVADKFIKNVEIILRLWYTLFSVIT